MTTSQTRQKLDELYCEYVKVFGKKEIVLGEGCITSSLVIIGEAPGKDEVKLGKPFVGAAGKNLNEFIGVLGIEREELFITNAIKYRLGKLNTKTQRIINRPATIQDIRDNQKWLHNEIKLLRPQIIVTLGNVPLKAISDNFKAAIGDMHGMLQTCNISGNKFKLFPLYHPASIIYNRALKEVYNQDILKLKKEISFTVTSEK
ncbi:MAG: uracil-DNA glycosylase [Ruminiclostridium sp.]